MTNHIVLEAITYIIIGFLLLVSPGTGGKISTLNGIFWNAMTVMENTDWNKFSADLQARLSPEMDGKGVKSFPVIVQEQDPPSTAKKETMDLPKYTAPEYSPPPQEYYSPPPQVYSPSPEYYPPQEYVSPPEYSPPQDYYSPPAYEPPSTETPCCCQSYGYESSCPGTSGTDGPPEAYYPEPIDSPSNYDGGYYSKPPVQGLPQEQIQQLEPPMDPPAYESHGPDPNSTPSGPGPDPVLFPIWSPP